MVLIAMAFISILGTILMFMAYTGYQIKSAEAKGERAFYSAETALDEVRAGIQAIVTECIAKAYTDMLVEYKHDMYDEEKDEPINLEDVFRRGFEHYFKTSDLFRQVSDGLFYNILADGDFVKVGDFISVTENINITSALETQPLDGQILGEVDRKAVGDEVVFVLKSIEISHSTADGFVSRVASDIVVVVPDFSYVRADYPINDIALIASETLNIPAADAGINDGIAFAGNITVNTGEHFEFSTNNTTLISSGNINVNGKFTTDSYSSLWARRIFVEKDDDVAYESSVQLLGDTYIADDLVLNGEESRAILKGRYYGFGRSLESADESSSIIVNGPGSTLDMSGLNTLFLAGHSFIDTGSGYNDILMGQSVSVKSDQLAYLVPASEIGLQSNPFIFDTAETPDTTGFEDDYHLVYRPVAATGQTLLFVFMKFDGIDGANGANTYFQKYFTDYSEEIKDYVSQYLNPYLLPDDPAANMQTSGYYYDLGIDDILISPVMPGVSLRLSRMYENITRSLSTSIQVGNEITPYSYIVDTNEVNKLENGRYDFIEDGNTRAVIIKCEGNSTTNISSLSPDVNLILSTGNVIADRAFEGLIISNGTIELYSSVTAAPRDIIPSIRAKNEAGDMFGKFLNQSFFTEDDHALEKSLSWDMSALVSYENWRRW